MKKNLLLATLFFVLFKCNAQTTIDTHAQPSKQEKCKWSCSFAINSMEAQIGKPEESSWGYATGNFNNFGDITNNSLSLSIIPKYFINDQFVLRFEFSISNIDLKNYYDSEFHGSITPETSHILITISIEQRITRYIPGIQFNFFKNKRIVSYGGMTLCYLQYDEMKYHGLYENRSLPGDTLIFSADDNAIAKGGHAFGIGAFMGFNLNVQKHIAIGVEFSDALLSYDLGGEIRGEATKQNIPNPPQTETYSYSTTSYKGIQFSKIIPSFNISILF